MNGFASARMHMIESQLRPNRVTHVRLLDAFSRIRREFFVPEHLRAVAYVDEDLPLGRGRSLIAPMLAARLLQATGPEAGDTALVVGAGTGYEAALLGVTVRAVVALEADEELARLARGALVEEGIASVAVVEGPLGEGHRPRAPYDIVLFGGAVAGVPKGITAQLREGGRLVAVVNPDGGRVGRATLMTRTGGVVAQRAIFDAAAPLLPGFAPKPAFVF